GRAGDFALPERRDRPARIHGGLTLDPVSGTERDLPADLVLLALGFTGPRPDDVLQGFGVRRGGGDRVAVSPGGATSVAAIFACGDAVRGASLVVNAIAEGRACAAAIDRHLRGRSV
ncbi:oxidoreductase, partial [mine drainage metagenome]